MPDRNYILDDTTAQLLAAGVLLGDLICSKTSD